MGVGRGSIIAALCAALALAGAQLARAGTFHPAAGDQAAAARGTLKPADLPASIGPWKPSTALSGPGSGGPAAGGCAGVRLDEGAVVTGRAVSEFAAPGADVQSEVTTLSTTAMLARSWSRATPEAMLPCLRQAFAHTTAGVEVVSLARVPFPAIAPHAAAYRVVYGAKLDGKPYRGALDMVLLAGGRTQILLSLVAELGTPAQAAAGEAEMTALERQLGQAMVRRALPPSA